MTNQPLEAVCSNRISMIPKTKMAERLMRWMLIHTAPAPLSIDHPVQIDLAEAADEIERLHTALSASVGYLRNAKIDLETGAPKRTALRTIEGGLAVAEAALSTSK